MMMDEGQERVRASYRGNYDRLARIKADRDPDNVFRLNQNIQPATEAVARGAAVGRVAGRSRGRALCRQPRFRPSQS